MYRIVVSNYFENFILCMIILSSCKLIVDTYIDFDSDSKTNSILAKISGKMDLGFNIIFTLEAFAKTIAYGFIMDKGSYLRESWN